MISQLITRGVLSLKATVTKVMVTLRISPNVLTITSLFPTLLATYNLAQGRLAVAHPLAAPHRQRPGLLQPLSRRRRGQGATARQPRCGAARRAAADRVPHRPAQAPMEPQRGFDRVGQRLSRTAGIDQHPSDPVGHHPSDQAFSARRHRQRRGRRVLRRVPRHGRAPVERRPPGASLWLAVCGAPRAAVGLVGSR